MSDLVERLPVPLVLRRHSTVAMFAAGFSFDLLTMQRIDAWTDLALQLGYLAGLTGLLVYQHWEATGRWAPRGRTEHWWRYNLEALHFLYGGLLSAYVVLYLRSSTAARPAVFLALLVGAMVVNEVPQVRRAGYRLRLGLHGFCLLSFLTYVIPIALGRIGGWVFLLSLLLSAALVWLLTRWLVPPGGDRAIERRRLFAPAAGVLLFVGVLYVLRLIPPVPLSVQFHGIYHEVRREGGAYTLVYEEPPAWALWRRDSRPFGRRDGDRLFYFARVFAPSGFRHRVVIRWEVFGPARGAWTTTDRIPIDVVGGRAEGFRGWSMKSNFTPGSWRVTAETEDGRAIATLPFRVEEDVGTGERPWRTLHARDSGSNVRWSALLAHGFTPPIDQQPPATAAAAATPAAKRRGAPIPATQPNASIVGLASSAFASIGPARSFRWAKIGRASPPTPISRRGLPASRPAGSSFRLTVPRTLPPIARIRSLASSTLTTTSQWVRAPTPIWRRRSAIVR